MSVDLGWIQGGAVQEVPVLSESAELRSWTAGGRRSPHETSADIKKPGPEDGPGKCWLVARIKVEAFSRRERAASSGEWEPAAEILRLRFLQPKDLPRCP